MTVSVHEENAGKVMIVKLSGKLTAEDYKHFVPELERQIKAHGKIRIMVDMHEFHGWDVAALWQDIKFDVKHFKDIERLAMVGESKWQSGMAAFCKPFTSATLKYFERPHEAEALAWLKE